MAISGGIGLSKGRTTLIFGCIERAILYRNAISGEVLQEQSKNLEVLQNAWERMPVRLHVGFATVSCKLFPALRLLRR